MSVSVALHMYALIDHMHVCIPKLRLAGSNGAFPVLMELTADYGRPVIGWFTNGSSITVSGPLDMEGAVRMLSMEDAGKL